MIGRTWTFALTAAALLPAAPMAAQDAAELAAWQEYATPGEQHQQLAAGAGNWRSELTIWMVPGAEPEHATSTSTLQSVLGGRYLVEEMRGTMMGMAYEGRGMFGYDNAKDQYFMVWIDNLGTGVMTGWGTAEGNTVTYTGTFVDNDTGEDWPFRSVHTVVDPDHTITEMYVPAPDGSEFKSLEIHSYRETP